MTTRIKPLVWGLRLKLLLCMIIVYISTRLAPLSSTGCLAPVLRKGFGAYYQLKIFAAAASRVIVYRAGLSGYLANCPAEYPHAHCYEYD